MKKKSKWRTVRRSAYVLVALGLVLPVLAFMAAYIVQDVPKPGDQKTNQVATVFAADGTTVIDHRDLHAGISSARGSVETQRLRSAAGVVRLRISGPFDVPTRRSLAN